MPEQTAPPGNTLILMSDEHNPFFCSVYGHPFIQTPNMERLARMGTTYDAAYCPSPLCHPARSSFISGRRVHEIQTYNNCNVFVSDHPTYGRVLAEQGVHTAHIGKVDVYTRPSELGFSEMILAGDRQTPGDQNIARAPLGVREDGAARASHYGVKDNPFPHDERCMEAGLKWLSETAPSLQQPWTLQLNLIKPHFPHYVTQELWDLYPQGADLPEHGVECETAQHPHAADLRRHFDVGGFTEEQVRGLRRGYLGCITYVDEQLGRVLDMLEETGALENTVIAYTSDHGEMLGKFGMWWKCTLYEDAVRVPLIVAGPGFDAGARVSTPVDLLDLQATPFAATGSRRPEEWTGAPLQEIAADDGERVVFAEYHGHGTRSSAFMVRRGHRKLIHYHDAPLQLFDLASDPDELHNLATAQPEVVRELERELHKVCSPAEENRRAEEFIARQLRALQESAGPTE